MDDPVAPEHAVRVQITASAERRIDAPAGRVYGYLADFRRHHPNFLPPQFSDFEIESGGVGAGTTHRFRITVGGRTTQYRVRVGEPQPGRVLIESDPARRMLTTFTVDPEPGGESRVRIETRWYTDGVRGLVERIVAPRLLRRVYQDELELLDRYAAAEAAAVAPPVTRHDELRGADDRRQVLVLRAGAHHARS